MKKLAKELKTLKPEKTQNTTAKKKSSQKKGVKVKVVRNTKNKGLNVIVNHVNTGARFVFYIEPEHSKSSTKAADFLNKQEAWQNMKKKIGIDPIAKTKRRIRRFLHPGRKGTTKNKNMDVANIKKLLGSKETGWKKDGETNTKWKKWLTSSNIPTAIFGSSKDQKGQQRAVKIHRMLRNSWSKGSKELHKHNTEYKKYASNAKGMLAFIKDMNAKSKKLPPANTKVKKK